MKKSALILLLISFLVSCTQKDYDYDIFSTLYGIVSDADTGDPVSGVAVILSPGGTQMLTGNDGYFEFSDLDPQQYTITVQKSGYLTNRKSVNAVIGEKTKTDITISKQN